METKTEQLSVSADASAVTETKKRAAAKKTTAKVTSKESSEVEKKAESRRSSHTMTEKMSTAKKNATSEKAIEKKSEKAEVVTPEEKKASKSVPTIDSAAVPPTEKKKSLRGAKKSASKKVEGAAEEEKTVEVIELEKPQKKAVKKPVNKQAEKKASASENSKEGPEKKSDKKPEKVVLTEKKDTKKTKKSSENTPALKKSTEREIKADDVVEGGVVLEQLSVEIADLTLEKKKTQKNSAVKENKSVRSSVREKMDSSKGKKKKEGIKSEKESSEARISEKISKKEFEEEASAASSIEEKLVAMAKKAVPAFIPSFLQNENTEAVDVSGTPRDTFVFYSPSQLAAMEKEKEVVIEKKSEGSAPKEAVNKEKDELSTESSATVKSEAADSSEIESKNAGHHPDSEKESAEVFEAVKRDRPERRIGSSRRNDPHERTVMDKDLARASIYTVLDRLGNLERRILIEETMKIIPLTDEERTDNHPTSLFNRVRSVVGSMLAEEISRGRIVADGRQLSIFKAEEKPASIEPVADVGSIIEIAEGSAEPASLEIELDFRTTKEEERAFETNEDDVHEMQLVSEPKTEEITVVALPATESAEVSAKISEASVASAPVPVREPSIRRTRQQRVDRRSASQGVNGAILLITEEELERVIMNALRRGSATKIDLLAVLKRTYIDAYHLSREEENRIYTVAGNLLQKLVNRGTVQNNDGRYLQKPSQRVLNPGRAPGAFFTGNVEARFITELNRQSGDFFEQFAARLLEKYFEMSNIRVDASYVVGGSDDNGIDIMLETTDWLGYKERVFVQAKKRATQPVTLKEVREFYGALCAEEGTRGVFITTSSFCMEASKMIGKLRNLIAIDKRKLFLLAEHCEVGLIRDEEGRLLLDENLFLDYEV